MYEFEVGRVTQNLKDHAVNIDNFDSKDKIEIFRVTKAAPHLWEEHCTECAMPMCYTTCELFEVRDDGKCRRFENGFQVVQGLTELDEEYVKVEFKKWANLLSETFIKVSDIEDIKKLTRYASFIELIARNKWLKKISVLDKKGLIIRVARKLKRLLVSQQFKKSNVSAPTHFIIDGFNPLDKELDFTLTIRSQDEINNKRPFQKRLIINPGSFSIKINYFEIFPFVDTEYKSFCSLMPNRDDNDHNPVLYLKNIGFVESKTLSRQEDNGFNIAADIKIKIVIWDLDNTIWDGVLVESENSDVQLKPDIVNIIKELDNRGIVNSISSKNTFDFAKEKLEDFGLFEYFVFPEINWNPKSLAINNIINNFNVGSNTVAFIDDSIFEREEVSSQHPDVLVIDALNYRELLSLAAFSPKISSESGQRRQFYKNQGIRDSIKDSFSGDYFSFLSESKIVININDANVATLDRIHELVQRTNQMNFSGNRYNKDEIENILRSEDLDSYQIECADVYGSYGTVGFCVVDRNRNTMIDLMFSCRIQSKRVEHAFLNCLIEKYKNNNAEYFDAIYKETEKNRPVGKVFKDLNFIKKGENILRFPFSNTLINDHIINVYLNNENI